MDKSGIYEIINTENNKRYIGQSRRINKRLKDHYYSLMIDKEPSKKLQHAWNKHGGNCFIFNIIEYCDVEELDKREIYWIDYFNSINNGYNATTGGKNNFDVFTNERKWIKENVTCVFCDTETENYKTLICDNCKYKCFNCGKRSGISIRGICEECHHHNECYKVFLITIL